MNVIDLVKTDTDDLSCHTGITFYIDMIMLNGCTDDPDDLTGYTASLKIYSGTAETASYTIAGTISNPTDGIITFSATATATAGYVVGMYRYQVELKLGATVYLVAQGRFEVCT
jgi:hypothetical protein